MFQTLLQFFSPKKGEYYAIFSMIMDIIASYDESDLSGKCMNCRSIVWFRVTKQTRPQGAFPRGKAPLETRLSNEDGDLQITDNSGIILYSGGFTQVVWTQPSPLAFRLG